MKALRTVLCLVMVIVALSVLWMAGAQGANRTWTGSTNTAWSQENNWDPTGVPTSSDNVFIPDVSNDPVIQSDAEANWVQINDSAVLTVDGGTLNVTDRIRVMSDSTDATLDLSNNATVVNTGELYNWGTLDIDNDRYPKVYLTGLYSYAGSTINRGYGTFTFNGGGINRIYIAPVEDIYAVRMDNASGELRVTSFNGLQVYNLYVDNGLFDPYAKKVTVHHRMYVDDEVKFINDDDWIWVGLDMYINDGAHVWGETGTLTVNDELYVNEGATVEFYWHHLLNVSGGYDSHFYINEDSAYFNNVTIEKTGGYLRLNTAMNITDDLVIESGDFRVYNSDAFLVDSLTIRSSGVFRQMKDSTVNVTWGTTIQSGGSLELGNSTNGWHGGDLDIGYDLNVQGRFQMSGMGGEVSVDRHLRVFSTGNMTIEGGNISGDPATSGCWFYTGSDASLLSSETTLHFNSYTHQVSTLWYVRRSASPTITVTNYLYTSGTLTNFHPGRSTVVATGTLSITNIDTAYPIWNLIVNKSSGAAKADYTVGTLNVSGSLLLLDGQLDPDGVDGHAIRVNGTGPVRYDGRAYRGFVNLGGELLMQAWNDSLDASHQVYWGRNSSASVDTGWIHCRGNWTFEEGSAINLTGNNTVRFYGNLMAYNYQFWTNSSTSSFCNVLHAMGMTSSYTNGTEPMVIDNDLTFWSLNALHVDDGELIVWGDANVTSILYVDDGGDMYVHGNLTVAGGPGRVDFGSNYTGEHGGHLDVNGWLSAWNGVNFYRDGGNLTVGRNVTINRTGSVEFRGDGGNMSCANILVLYEGAFRIYSENTTVSTGLLRSEGELNISRSDRPTLRLSGDLDWWNGDFRLGRSEVRAVGTGDQRLEDSHPYWGLVVDKPSGSLSFEYSETIVAESYLGVARGTFTVADHHVLVRGSGSFPTDGYPIGVNRYPGFIMDGGEMHLNHSSGLLEIDGIVRWFGGTANATEGVIESDASWTLYAGVEADIECPVILDPSVYSRTFTSYSRDFTFRYLEVNGSSSITQTSYSHHPIHVTRDLWMNNSDNFDELNITKGLIVDRDIHIRRGALVLSHGAEVTVGDDFEMLPNHSNGWVRVYNGSMDVGGYFHCEGFGVEVAHHGGSMDITGPLWIDSQLPPASPGFHVGQNEGYSFRLSAEFVRINASGVMNLTANDTRIVSLADFIVHGTLRSYGHAMPDIVTYDELEGSGTFLLGHSSVWFEGSNAYQDVSDMPYWNLVVNKTSGRARSMSDISVESCLFILDGIYDMNGYRLWVNSSGNSFIFNGTHYSGFVNFGGELVYLTTDEVLTVNGPVVWGPGVNQTFDIGTLYVNGSWEFMAGSRVNFTGTHLVYFFGMNGYDPYPSWAPIISHSAGSSFNNVTADRDTGYGQFTSYESTEVVVVKGDLDLTGGYFDVASSAMHVMGDVDVDGPGFVVETLNPYGNSSLDVDGNVYVQSGAILSMTSTLTTEIGWLNCSNLTVNGSMELQTTTSVNVGDDVNVRGSIELAPSSGWAELVSADWIYVHPSGYIDMSSAAPSHLNSTTDSIIVYNGGSVDLRGNANVYMWGTFYPYGTVDCTGWFPRIRVGGLWYSDATGDFRPGWSEVTFFRTGNSYIRYTDEFADLIVNKPSGSLRLQNTDITCSDLDVESGTFRTNGFNLTATDDVTVWGSLEMDHDGWVNASDKFIWMAGSSEDITNGTLQCNGTWIVEDGADMTLEDPVGVLLNANTNVTVHDDGSYFNNVTYRTAGFGSEAVVRGNGTFNVTSMLRMNTGVYLRVKETTVEVEDLHVYTFSRVNLSDPDAALFVWNEFWLDSDSMFVMYNESYAWVRDFNGGDEFYLFNGSNLTVVKDLVGTRMMSRNATVHFTGTGGSVLNIPGRFHDLVLDKSSGISNYEPLLIGGDLRIFGGTLYPQSNDVEIWGDMWCAPSASYRPANGSRLIFNGSGTQFIDTGGSDPNHELYDLVVSQTDLVAMNSSISVRHNVTIEHLSIFWVSGDNMTLYTGEDGLWNNGTFYFDGHSGRNAIVFHAGSNVINNGTMMVLGNMDHRTQLESSSPGTQWHLNDSTPELFRPAFDRIRVTDSDADPGNTIYADGTSIDGGNNDNWVFGKALTLTLSGLEDRVVNLTVVQWNMTQTYSYGDGRHETWADGGTSAEIEDVYVVTSDEERYYTEDTTSWTVNENVTAGITYYRQWKPVITLDGTDGSHNVTAYYSTLGGSSSQDGQHTSWSRWIDNGTALSFDKEASGTPTRHTGEDFDIPPWDPLTSALVYTLDYAGNEWPELINGTMDPSSGNLSTVFNFTVEYWDANDDAPHFIYVNIDGTNFTMNKTDPDDHDYTDGCEYHYETLLSGGDHDYHFIANDTYVTNQTAVEQTGTVIPEFGPLPVLISMMAVGVAVIWRRRRR